MKLYLTDGKQINMYTLPKKIEDPFLINYLTENGLEETINIIAKDGHWEVESNPETTFFNNGLKIEKETLINNAIYQIKFSDEATPLYLYCFDIPIAYNSYDLAVSTEITVGSDPNNTISYQNQNTQPKSFIIKKDQNNNWTIDNYGINQEIYINNYKFTKKVLNIGDTIFINGLKIIWMNTFIKINTPKDFTKISLYEYKNTSDNNKYDLVSDQEKASVLYNDDQVFFHTPRLKENIKKKTIDINYPPKKHEENKTPLFLQLGGTIVMGLSSCITGVIAMFNVMSGESSLLSSITEIAMCVSLLLGSILFPILVNNYQKKQTKKDEEKRVKKYTEYLNEIEKDINSTIEKEKQLLLQYNLSIKEIQSNIVNRSNKIWNREITDNDFLTLRLGLGNKKPELIINSMKNEFTLEEDELITKADELSNRKFTIENVPIIASLIEDRILPVIINENYQYKKQYIDALILQLITYYSGSDLKLIIITSEENKNNWEYLKYLPHCSSKDQEHHYFATTEDEIKQLTNELEKIRYERSFNKNEENKVEEKKNEDDRKYKYKEFDTYYLIITDNFKAAKKYECIQNIIDSESNVGFSILMIEENMKNIPSRCNHFIDINNDLSGMFSKDLEEDSQRTFTPEIQPDNNNHEYSKILANIPLIGSTTDNSLPTSLSFLEMYKVGKIEQLNIANRWINNDPTTSLHTPLGVRTDGKLFEIDLHEKAHGPHGLIAGSTGSGKSEFIITFILSMAINYHPYEVSFVLIDYKGGGLAGAFENKETGIKLPHLAGTITNLDESEMNRTLVSIKSELKRRQRKFNEARDALNESTVDIYKYQKYYREGKVKDPISHLFIISDEFAELKSQQPDFMDELISTARIGRSLGVHLILATQKPSGVVDDQIWSNARFKICLKVQDAADSNELLKRPDAASIKETGRFYLQVGYNELFDIGQSGWAGAKYNPTDRILKTYEDDISFIDNVGNLIKKVNDKTKVANQVDNGEQLTNIVKYIYELSNKESIASESLWLPSIKPEIYLSDLMKKYNYKQEPNSLKVLLGEYDDPENQLQDKLVLSLKETGNILVYGITGSGKENLLTTLIYTACINHTPEEVNFYLLDFGAEILNMFEKMPHVGDIATVLEKNKIISYFQFIEREINKRKELFKNYGGNYNEYVKQTNNKLPFIITVINNYNSFCESFGEQDDNLSRILRDCAKYGVIFITTLITNNSMSATTQQSYATKLVMQQADEYDYSYILDSENKVKPAKHFGRGLIKFGKKAYEFQTANIYIREKIMEAVKQTSEKMETVVKSRAPKIPNVPKAVMYETLMKQISELDKVPVGFDIKTANVSTIDLINNKITFVTGKQVNSEPTFIEELAKTITAIPNAKLRIIDFAENMSNLELPDIYTGEFTKVMNSIIPVEKETKQKVIYIITGIGYIYDKVLDEGIAALFNIFNNPQLVPNSSFILSDNQNSIKKLENEAWYQKLDLKNGIWIGNGIDTQNSININEVKLYDLNENFNGIAYNIKNGEYEIIKALGTSEENGGDFY